MSAKVSIRETNVITNGDKMVVQLYIADAARESESAQTVVELNVCLPSPKPGKLMALIQREAIRAADGYLSEIRRNLAKEIEASHHDLNEPWT